MSYVASKAELAGLGGVVRILGLMGAVLSETREPSLQGRRILIVEDRYLVADDLCRICARHGAEIAGPVADLGQACELAHSERLDAAILDVDLRGQDVAAVAAILNRRGVPFVFVTGYSQAHLPADYRDRPLVPKPFSDADLIAGIVAALEPDAPSRKG